MDRDDQVIEAAISEKGMAQLTPDEFEDALLDLVSPWLSDERDLLVVASGMVGAKQGWREAPYISVPCVPAQDVTFAPTKHARLRVAILPGVSQSEPADVMRGEETQVLGFLDQFPVFSGVICLPGTHSKWVRIAGGKIVEFQAFVTGELYAAICAHTVLRHSLTGSGWRQSAFQDAVDDTLSAPEATAAALFRIRAEDLLRGTTPDIGQARLSGTLIGFELNAARRFWERERVVLLGSPDLCARYASALDRMGTRASTADIDACTLAGLKAAHKTLLQGSKSATPINPETICEEHDT
ncbi:MAG: 2-dehydro-3-deoxygalactonokinase [Rhizobiaceae bacterium]|nr:2-dehydro-3-deoxygalactonokinase [Rhizobiaceae bacterium]